LTSKQRTTITVSLAAAALVACVAHGYWVSGQIDAARAEQARIETPGKQMQTLQKQKADAEKKLKETKDANAVRLVEVEQAEQTLDAHRRRLGLLLERLSKDASGQWVLRKIEGNPSELMLVGVTMHPEHISGMAAAMAADLAKLGWAVDPPEQQARNQRDDGGPWTFSLRLRDQSVATPLPAAEPIASPSNIVRTPGK
jgi:hypothetical protein